MNECREICGEVEAVLAPEEGCEGGGWGREAEPEAEAGTGAADRRAPGTPLVADVCTEGSISSALADFFEECERGWRGKVRPELVAAEYREVAEAAAEYLDAVRETVQRTVQYNVLYSNTALFCTAFHRCGAIQYSTVLYKGGPAHQGGVQYCAMKSFCVPYVSQSKPAAPRASQVREQA